MLFRKANKVLFPMVYFYLFSMGLTFGNNWKNPAKKKGTIFVERAMSTWRKLLFSVWIRFTRNRFTHEDKKEKAFHKYWSLHCTEWTDHPQGTLDNRQLICSVERQCRQNISHNTDLDCPVDWTWKAVHTHLIFTEQLNTCTIMYSIWNTI